MRSLLISLLVVLLAATIQAGVFKKEKVKLGKKNCLCDFNIEIGDTCSGSVKCDKKCSGSGTVELGGCSFTLAVKKGKGKISKCSCEAATLPVPTEPTIGPGSGETPVPMTGSGSGETPVPMTGSGSGETPVPIPTSPGSGSGGEGMQCSCKCNCPDGSGECDCDCNCPMTSKTVTCAPGFSKVCPMMGDMCPQDMDPICPHNAISRMGGNAAEGMDKGCQCVPDFLLAMVMIQPTGRMEAVDRAMTKATIQVGKKKCKCSYEMNAENCKKSKIICDKKCSGKESGVELADGDVMYMVDIAVKKGKVTIAKCDVEAPEPTGTGGGSTGSGSGNGEGGMGGMVSRCACVSKGMGGSGPTVPTLPPTGSGSEPAPPTGSGSEPAPPTGSGSEPAPPTGSGSEPAPQTESGSGSGILIAGGFGAKTSTEVFLPGSGKTCTLANLPDRRSGHTLDTVSNTGVLCGGYDTRTSCLQFSQTTGTWSSYATTLQGRDAHSSWVSPAGLLLMAGRDNYTTSEIVNGGMNFTLVQSTVLACSIQLGPSAIITGGYNTPTDVSRYNLQGWVEDLPSLLEGRQDHACGSFRDGGDTILVVAGGRNNYGAPPFLSSTEVHRIGSSQWTAGQPLPRAMDRIASVSVNQEVIIMGGFDGGQKRSEILLYKEGKWNEVGQLGIARYGAAATMILVNTTMCD